MRISTKLSERLNEGAEALAARIENAIAAIRIVPATSEASVRTRKDPIQSMPRDQADDRRDRSRR